MRIVALGVLLLLTGCQNDQGACVCTGEFRAFGLTVVDSAQNPVNGVSLTTTDLRTGDTLVSTFLGLATPGTYWIVDDNMTDAFRPAGDSVRVVGSKSSLGFSADFVFATDACGCHISKLAGLDTVTIQ